MLKNNNIELKNDVIDIENHPMQHILLNGESLARHFRFVNPTLKKRVAFGISDLFNSIKNKEDKKDKNEISIDQNIEEYPLVEDLFDDEYEGFDSNEEIVVNEVTLGEKKDKWHKWDVIDTGLILGVIPESHMMNDIKLLSQFTQYSDSQLMIVSITDDFELAMGTKVQPKQHKDNGNQHYLMPMTDFGGGATTPEAVLAAVYQIRQAVLRGNSIYIHCKAGRARSAMVVATYLAIYPPKDATFAQYDLKGAIEYLKSKRTQVNLHQKSVADNQWDFLHDPLLHNIKGIGKLEKASQAINLHQKLIERQKDICEVESKDSNENFVKIFNLANDLPIEAFNENAITNYPAMKHGDSILSSLEFKNHLVQMNSFKQLKVLATQSQSQGKRVDYVNEMCEMILNATNDNWFVNRSTEAKNPVTELFYNSNSSDELRDSVNTFLADIAQYKKDQIEALGIKQSTNEIQLKNLNDHMHVLQGHVKNLHKLSKKSMFYEKIGTKRCLEQSWDTVCEKNKAFQSQPYSRKRIKELLDALDVLNIRLSNRIKEEAKFINKNKGYQENLANYSNTISAFKMDVKAYHNIHAKKERQQANIRFSNGLFDNRNDNFSVDLSANLQEKKFNI